MRAVVQRVKEARVVVDDRTVGSIDQGLLVFLGVEQTDDQKDAEYLISKLSTYVFLKIVNTNLISLFRM